MGCREAAPEPPKVNKPPNALYIMVLLRRKFMHPREWLCAAARTVNSDPRTALADSGGELRWVAE